MHYTKPKDYLNTKVGSEAQCSESDLSPLVMEKISELATAPLSKKMFLTTLKDEVMITLCWLFKQVTTLHFSVD